MDDWQADWERLVATVSRDLGQWVDEVAQGVDDAAEAVVDFSDDVSKRLDEAIAPRLDEFDQEMQGFMEPLIDPLVEWLSTVEATLMGATAPINQTVDPILNEHSACVGCRNYHGQSYSGHMLVCAMHPYGWDDDQCPDFESTWGDRP
ncbi:MAG: hypothetical protein KME20_23595 [Kaiparowitsia implicata GSE-PSE-MK54-09C]|jgi:hypothetical protein|nr:hypothetical protein [Kaiparowitsia implicata GSE-PSE-MK54-09C]